MKWHFATSTALRVVRRGLGSALRRILDGAEAARYHDMQREIQRVIGQTDGHLCDETERRINRHLMRLKSF